MKPHEETWEVDEQAVKDGDYTATDSDGFAVLTTYAREEGGSDELAEARLRLATVAPEMARALLLALAALRENGLRASRERTALCGHEGECRFQRAAKAMDAAESALAKAGVMT